MKDSFWVGLEQKRAVEAGGGKRGTERERESAGGGRDRARERGAERASVCVRVLVRVCVLTLSDIALRSRE